MFVNFKDHKGNITQALEKMVNDLRKFGVQVAKNCRVEHLSSGTGEVVCHLIDELLNVELFRREYQFGQPKIPNDEDADDDNDGTFNGDNMDGTQEMFGIKIRQDNNKQDIMGGTPTAQRRRVMGAMNIEETKINFFDPSAYGELEAPYEKPAEDLIIEARFDPVDWRAELDRVYMDLVAIEKDV